MFKNLISVFGVFSGIGFLILKAEEKEKIRKIIRQAIFDNHPLILSLESERYNKLREIEKSDNDIFNNDNYIKKIHKDEINKEYEKLIRKAIDNIESSKDEIEKVKKIIEKQELSKKYWEEEQINNKVRFEKNVIKYAEDVYFAFDGYESISKNDFRKKLFNFYNFSEEKFHLFFMEITSVIYGIVEETYGNTSEYLINYEIRKKPDVNHEKYNRLFVYYDEWKLKNGKINNEIEEKLRNKKNRIQNVEKYGEVIKEIFVGYDFMAKHYFKQQLQLKLNITEIESNNLLNSLLNQETGLVEQDWESENCIVIGSEFKFKRE